MYKSNFDKPKEILSNCSNPIKKSHNHINEIADLKKQNADPETIKNKTLKYTTMSIEQYRKHQEKVNNNIEANKKTIKSSSSIPIVDMSKPLSASASINNKRLQNEGLALSVGKGGGDLPALKVELIPPEA